MKLSPEEQRRVADQLRAILGERKAALAAGPRSLRDLASVLGVAPPSLQSYLNGTRSLSTEGDSAVTLGKIAEAVGVKQSELLT